MSAGRKEKENVLHVSLRGVERVPHVDRAVDGGLVDLVGLRHDAGGGLRGVRGGVDILEGGSAEKYLVVEALGFHELPDGGINLLVLMRGGRVVWYASKVSKPTDELAPLPGGAAKGGMRYVVGDAGGHQELCVLGGMRDGVRMRCLGNSLTIEEGGVCNHEFLWKGGRYVSMAGVRDLRASVSVERVRVQSAPEGYDLSGRKRGNYGGRVDREEYFVVCRETLEDGDMLSLGGVESCKRWIREHTEMVTDRYLFFACVRLFDGTYLCPTPIYEVGDGEFGVCELSVHLHSVTADGRPTVEGRVRVPNYAFRVRVGVDGVDKLGSEALSLVSGVDLFAYRYDPYVLTDGDDDKVMVERTNGGVRVLRGVHESMVGYVSDGSGGYRPRGGSSGAGGNGWYYVLGRCGYKSLIEVCDGFHKVGSWGVRDGFKGEVCSRDKVLKHADELQYDGRGLWGDMDRWVTCESFDWGMVMGVVGVQGVGSVVFNNRVHVWGVRELYDVRGLTGLDMESRDVPGGDYSGVVRMVCVSMRNGGRVVLYCDAVGDVYLLKSNAFLWSVHSGVERVVVCDVELNGGVVVRVIGCVTLVYSEHDLLPISYVNNKVYKEGGAGGHGGVSARVYAGNVDLAMGGGGAYLNVCDISACKRVNIPWVVPGGSEQPPYYGEFYKVGIMSVEDANRWLSDVHGYVRRNNVLRVSEQDSGMSWQGRGVYSFQHDVRACVPMQMVMSDHYRYGVYPLYVFTGGGVISMQVGDGGRGYEGMSFEIGDVLSDGRCLASTPYGVVYVCAGGVKLLGGGGGVRVLSDRLNMGVRDEVCVGGLCIGGGVRKDGNKVSPLDDAVVGFEGGSSVGMWYDARYDELLYGGWVYEFGNGSWYRRLVGDEVRWSVGGVLVESVVGGDIGLRLRSCCDVGTAVGRVLVCSRGIGLPDGYERVSRVRVLCEGRFGSGGVVSLWLLGSVNGRDYEVVRGVSVRGAEGAGMRDVVMSVLRSRGYRYVSVLLVGVGMSDMDVHGVSLELCSGWDNKVR